MGNKETLEEASEKYNPRFNRLTKKEIFEAGVKWQQERSYNLDDLKEAFFMGRVGKTIKDFNEQFKNK